MIEIKIVAHFLLSCINDVFDEVIFRDLKPDNIGFDSNGTVKIFDFGVARDLEYVRQVGDKLGFTGTPRYMAPEGKC